ncbi:MAG: pSer/pThr/pTyr-binding forkhead associated (FHA) protein [Myxococcota bacterium]|jgi:pSer/pThr/pTyr-binding forkhead associated (FHA) protein
MQPHACQGCGRVNPSGYLFCGFCGGKLAPPEAPLAREPSSANLFEASEVQRTARLVLLRGSGGDGASYYLRSEEHVCGRLGGTILFPDDPTVSPEHANFFYRDGRLYLRDLGSANGTFIRLRRRIPLEHGDRFVCGEQLFQFGLFQSAIGERWVGDTCFCGSAPLWNWQFQVGQILSRGRSGVMRCVETGRLTIGREDCSLSFAQDRFMSHYHAQVVPEDDQFFLQDTDSKNGTYYRIRGDVGLQNGDYLFLGRQLIRIELT